MFGECLENVRTRTPLIHNITNYVTVNDVANILLACGGSPIMSDDIEEVEEITSICGGLNINIGTLNQRIPARTKNPIGKSRLCDPLRLFFLCQPELTRQPALPARRRDRKRSHQMSGCHLLVRIHPKYNHLSTPPHPEESALRSGTPFSPCAPAVCGNTSA